MARLVLGMGTSQSSILTIPPEHWAERGKRDSKSNHLYRPDGTKVSFTELAGEAGDRFKGLASEPNFARVSAGAQAAVKRLAADLAKASPDILVVIADDQAELFDKNNMPAVAIYRGAELATGREGHVELPKDAPQWQRDRYEIANIDPSRHYPGAPGFADELIGRLSAKEFDVAAIDQPADPRKGIGHAWAFVANCLLDGRSIPMVPLILNTWYRPNVPTPRRCYDLGVALRQALAEMPQDIKVAVITSGGMSHHLINEDLDREVLSAIQEGNVGALLNIKRESLMGGTCQIRDWVCLAGAVEGLKNQWMEYLPGYRSTAGTGVGLAFATWA